MRILSNAILDGSFLVDFGKREYASRLGCFWEHFASLGKWNKDASHPPFLARLNMDKIALMGHSRGGEASLVMRPCLNALDYYPMMLQYHKLGINFNIKALLASPPS